MIRVNDINRMSTKIIGLLLFFTFNIKAFSQYNLPVENYDLTAIGAANQNWGISQGDDGSIYVANNLGLVHYDGMVWKLFPLPNKTVMRSVLFHNGNLYSGSYQEFGVWKRDQTGDLYYTSFLDLINEKSINNQEIWKIIAVGEKIYFQTFNKLYEYFEGEINTIEVPSMLISLNVIHGELFLGTKFSGIFKLKDHTLIKVVDNPILHTSNIVSVNAYNNGYLISTSLDGLFVYQNGLLSSLNAPINDLLKEHQLNNTQVLENGRMLFGTIKNGFYITSSQGNILFRINRTNSINNNTVLNQLITKSHEIWLTLDNGLSKIYLDQPTYFEDKSGQLGVVYAMTEFGGKIYIGSNTGLYFIENDQLHFVQGSQGQVWFLKEVGGELFCGHNSGTFIVENNHMKLISDYSGGWTIREVPNKREEFLIGTYVGLIHLKKQANKWISTKIGNETIPIRYLEFESPQTVWMAHAYKGLYRLTLDENQHLVRTDTYLDRDLGSDFNVKILKINGSIRFKTNSGWMKYEPIIDKMIMDEILNETVGDKNDIIYTNPTGNQVVVRSDEGVFLKSNFSSGEKIDILNPVIRRKLIVGKEQIIQLNSKNIINIVDGFAYLNFFKSERNLIPPKIQRIQIDNQYIPTNTKNVQLSFGDNNIAFELTAPQNEHYNYQYRLNRVGDWKSIENNQLYLQNLKEHLYQVEFRTIDKSMIHSAAISYEFKVLPPWYFTTQGYLLFSVIGLVIIALIYSYQRFRINHKEKLIKEEYQQKQKKLIEEKEQETEKKLLEHKTNSLKNELKLKSKRLADSAMELGRKNEEFQKIKSELISHREYIKNDYWFKKIIRQINKVLEDKDHWALFEKNFNQVHEEFFDTLNRLHPKLTAKDLKLCAYIKMNLSNKEIAPLMNITVRGVETHRFRLNKKLELDGVALFDYIKSL